MAVQNYEKTSLIDNKKKNTDNFVLEQIIDLLVEEYSGVPSLSAREYGERVIEILNDFDYITIKDY